MKNFAKNLLTHDDRTYIVRTLSTMLMTYVQRPSMADCAVVAKSLVHQHIFLKDGDSEEGYVSFCYACFMMLPSV